MTHRPWHDTVRAGTEPPRFLGVPPLPGVLHPPPHQIVGTQVSPVLAIEVVKFGTGGESAFRATKFLLYLDFVAPFTLALKFEYE